MRTYVFQVDDLLWILYIPSRGYGVIVTWLSTFDWHHHDVMLRDKVS